MPGKPGTPDLDVPDEAAEAVLTRDAEVKVVPAGGVVIGEQEARQLQAMLEGKPVPDDVKQRLLSVVTPKTTIHDRLVDLLARTVADNLSPAESMRRVGRELLNHQEAHLTDDATMMLLLWPGPAG